MANNGNFPVWPGWETVRLIGRGSFGAVYEIERDVFGDTEKCALKHIEIPHNESEIREMRSEGLDEKSITQSLADQARDIVKEYKMMARLNDCPNIVTCHDVDYNQRDGGYGWDIRIRMELLTPLMDLLSEGRDWSESDTLRLGTDMCTALDACSRLNILHRDIKPHNIFVAENGSYKLGDFGIARTTERTSSATPRIGTYNYMAPEVFNGQHYGATADIYSLGMVLYWLLNERRAPFVRINTAKEKESAQQRRMSGEQIPPPAHGSEELKRIVLKACAYDPKDRYRSAEEMLRDLEALSTPYAPRRSTPPAEPAIPQPGPIEPEKPELPYEDTVGAFGGEAAKEPEEDDGVTVDVFYRKDPDEPQPPPGKKTPRGLIGGIAALLALLLIAFFTIHSWKPATCTEPETCRICGKTRGEALGHDWGEWTVVSEPTCTEGGLWQRICANDPSHVETEADPATGYNADIGSYVVFGSYEQDNNSANGKEDIEWLVLAKEGNRLLVISRYALDCKRYNTESKAVTWENCSLRSWLNDSFLNTAFSAEEKTHIPTVTVSADKNPSYSTDPGKKTEEKVFLLSIAEAEQYFAWNEARKCVPTAFAKANGCYVSDSGSCWWWLRSPGYSANFAAGVYTVGSVCASGRSVNYDSSAIRPALWIDLGS